jgi:hypothetical protein
MALDGSIVKHWQSTASHRGFPVWLGAPASSLRAPGRPYAGELLRYICADRLGLTLQGIDPGFVLLFQFPVEALRDAHPFLPCQPFSASFGQLLTRRTPDCFRFRVKLSPGEFGNNEFSLVPQRFRFKVIFAIALGLHSLQVLPRRT